MPDVEWNRSHWAKALTDWSGPGNFGCQWLGGTELDEIVSRYVIPHTGADKVIAEIGPGGGRLTKFLLDCKELHLFDVVADFWPYLQKILNLNHANFYCVDHCTLKPCTKIDFIHSYGVFVHLDDDSIATYFSEFNRTKVGIATINYCNRDLPIEISDMFAKTTANSVEKLALDAGLRIVENNPSITPHSGMIVLTAD